MESIFWNQKSYLDYPCCDVYRVDKPVPFGRKWTHIYCHKISALCVFPLITISIQILWNGRAGANSLWNRHNCPQIPSQTWISKYLQIFELKSVRRVHEYPYRIYGRLLNESASTCLTIRLMRCMHLLIQRKLLYPV